MGGFLPQAPLEPPAPGWRSRQYELLAGRLSELEEELRGLLRSYRQCRRERRALLRRLREWGFEPEEQ